MNGGSVGAVLLPPAHQEQTPLPPWLTSSREAICPRLDSIISESTKHGEAIEMMQANSRALLSKLQLWDIAKLHSD